MNQNTLQQDSSELGERLALLLAASQLPDDVKAGYLTMIPEMSLEQLVQLVQAFEANINQSIVQENPELIARIDAIMSQYNTTVNSATKTAMDDMAEIEALLNQPQA